MTPLPIAPRWRLPLLLSLGFLALAGILALWFVLRPFWLTLPRLSRLDRFFSQPELRPTWRIPAGERCSAAPFQWPADGYVGFFWGDSFAPPRRHTGLDIFGGEGPNQTAVHAAADGHLTRLDNWKSSLILRIPSDPLQPERQIWLYYTHMADSQGESFIAPEFPAGTHEIPVKAGQLLGYMGDYSGAPGVPTGVHLHFSIVLSAPDGSFLNEASLGNTLDPSSYFGRALANGQTGEPIPPCLQP